jgi:hypothetical protein
MPSMSLKEEMYKQVFIKTGGREENPAIIDICHDLSKQHYKDVIDKKISDYKSLSDIHDMTCFKVNSLLKELAIAKELLKESKGKTGDTSLYLKIEKFLK